MGLTTEAAAVLPDSSSYRLLLAATAIFAFAVLSVLRSWKKLRHIPGPFLTSFTNIPRFRWVVGNRAHEKHIELHRQYGKLVRFGPNMVSIGDAAEIPKIYGIKGTYHKSDFYHVLLPYAKGNVLPGLFSAQDEDLHRILKRPIASIYSMSNLVSFESYVDSTISVFFEQLDKRFVATREICPLDDWLQMFAFDVIGEITFSKRLGFLERGEDVSGIMRNIWEHFSMAAPVGQMPWMDKFWAKNPIFAWLKPEKTNPTVAFALACMAERQDTASDEEKQQNDRDFLSRFLEAKDKGSDKLPPWALLAWTTSNITAGSDTTAIMLRTIFYHLLTHPESLKRLLTELDEAGVTSPVTWEQAQKLPFLDAVIKEAGRVHPPFGLPLERIVPEGGAEICGQYFEPGTIVGINAWVAHRDKDMFGDDCDVWRPERWVECEEDEKKRMSNALLTFGAGHRSCIGKNISLLEVYKLVPSILQRYKIEFAHPNGNDWEVNNRWFVVQKGLAVRLSRREE